MNKMFNRRVSRFRIRPLAALILLSLGVTEAQAQSRYELEEIVVTSRKIEEGLQNAPLAVTAISGLELENRGAVDVTDFASIAPNVALKESGTTSGFSAAPRTSIRGIGQGDFVINTDPAVGLYADGVYLGRSLGSILDLVDVERVEALRGPQGTLFGRNSVGGAINVIAIKPDVEAGVNGYTSVAFGEDGYLLLRGSANVPLSDTVAARVTLLRKERDGFVPSLIYDNLDFGDTETTGGRVALRWTPTDSFTADLDVDLSERTDTAAPTFAARVGDLSVGETGLASGAQPTGISSFVGGRVFNGEGFTPPVPANIQAFQTDDPLCATSQAYRDSSPTCFGNFYAGSLDGSFAAFFDREGNLERPDDQTIETYGYSVRLNWDLENVSISSVSSWRGFDSNFINGNATPVLLGGNRNEVFEQDQFSQELQISGTAFGDKIDWLLGGYYFEEDGYERVVVISPFLPPSFNNSSDFLPIGNIQNRFIDNNSTALFGQGIAHLTDTVDLTIGLRRTEDEKFAQYIVLNDNFDPNDAGVVNLIGNQQATETNTLVNLSWQVTDNTLIYGQFADGFRSGGFPSRLGGGQTEILEYDPEF
ncbi:TonB-dependent receptor, partial [Arenicella sp.]|nr:TonB-dependent receptor [Arenicella sp.]